MSSKTKNKEYALFDKYADDWWNENGVFKVLHLIRPIRLKYILNQINNPKNKKLKILDVGCGGGLVSESLAKLGFDVTGIDFVEKNIEVAKLHSSKKKLKIRYLKRDIEKNFVKDKFDIIIIFELLEHLEDWKDFLSKIKRNLNKNGIIIISTINRNIISKFLAISVAENLLKWVPKNTHQYDKFIRPNEIDDLLKKNKFHFMNKKGLIFDPFSFDWKLSNNTSINYFCTYKKY